LIKCISHKKVFPTLEIAEEALIEARSNFEYGAHSGPVAVYHCDDCGYYHLTSKGPVNPKLDEAIRSGKLKLRKEANKWLNKIDRRR
jgi:hypothetical protein